MADESLENYIETDRLILRKWQLDDAEALYKYASDVRVCELALWPRHESVEMSRKVIEEFFLPNPDNLAITLKSTGEPIGCIGLVPSGEEHFKTADEEREVGYWIGYPYWNKGLTTEALKGLIEYYRDCKGVNSLLLTTDNRNIASQRVAEKCGFQFISDYEYDGISSKSYRLTSTNPVGQRHCYEPHHGRNKEA